MTIRILNPLDWTGLMPGEGLKLNGDHDRKLVIELNCEAPTSVRLVHHDVDGVERTTFLASVHGLEKIEVAADADAWLDFTTDGEVWFCTNDGVLTAVELDEASFTAPLTRKSRNEMLEQMMRIQQSSMERLMIQQQEALAENERLASERDALRAAANNPPTAGAPGDGAQPEPAASAAPAAAGEGASPPPAAPTVPA